MKDAMPHLDEGQLHAYLDADPRDGTTAERQQVERHVATCAECRARLDQERRIRDRARAILGATGPASRPAPPFEAVLERAATRRADRRRIRPAVVLAWAASLALAATVGWYARGLIVTRPGAGAARAVAEGEARATGIEARPPAPREVAQAGPRQADSSRPLVEAPAGAGAVASTTGVAAQDRPLANIAAAETKAAVDTEARHLAEAPAPAAPPAPALRQTEGREAARRMAVPPPAMEQAWVTVTPSEAENRLGGPLALIPGLPSLGTSVYGAGQALVARTIQVLGPGQTIELVQQRAEAGAAAHRERAAAPVAAAQPRRAMRDEPGLSLTVDWEGFSVTGRALVPADSLRKLLQRLTAAERIR